MSTLAPRGRGGTVARGSRGASSSTTSAPRGSTRGRQANAARGFGRGSRGGSPAAAASGGQGLLQQLRTGTVARGGDGKSTFGGRGRGTIRAAATPARGRGRGQLTKSFGEAVQQHTEPTSRSSSPAPFVAPGDESIYSNAKQRVDELKEKRVVERRAAISMGFLADPENKTTLDQAITPVGTCEEMCPPFERAERIVQFMVDRCEKIPDPNGGPSEPAEEIMVKRFRRSAAGDDEQLPSDIRTPDTLRRTLDYLIDSLVGGPERLAVVHKFVWDRTRAIRNDFSIQQVTKDDDVRTAVECFERIARFHIMALHQLSNPDNLLEDENFDVFQEREQFNNTLLSLMYYYDDNRGQIDFPNEAEFRAYQIVLSFQSQHPDVEDRIQSWPSHLIADPRIQTALRLYQAAGNIIFDQGPLKPTTPFVVARNNSANFWALIGSGAVWHNLACVAEMHFNQVRFCALTSLLASAKGAPAAQRAKFRDWTLSTISEYLALDSDDQTADFCAAFGLTFETDPQGVTYLNLAGAAAQQLDASSTPKQQLFSHSLVEQKRCRRSLVAIINDVKPADALRRGLVEEADPDDAQADGVNGDEDSLFIPEQRPTFGQSNATGFGSFNPEATAFKPSSPFGAATTSGPSIFGNSTTSATPGSLGFTRKFGEASPFGTSPEPPKLSSKFGEFASQGFAASSPEPPKLTSKFGEQFGTPQESTAAAPFSTRFGQSAQSSTSTPMFGQDNGRVFGQTTSAGAADKTAAPNFMTMFGTSRPSNTENNPFGQKPVEQASPKSNNALPAFGASALTSSTVEPLGMSSTPFSGSTTGNTQPFSFGATPTSPSASAAAAAATSIPLDSVAANPKPAPFFNFGSPTPSSTEKQAPQQPFGGFSLNKSSPSAPAAAPPSQQSSNAPPLFSFNPQQAGQPQQESSSAAPSVFDGVQPAFSFTSTSSAPTNSAPPSQASSLFPTAASSTTAATAPTLFTAPQAAPKSSQSPSVNPAISPAFNFGGAQQSKPVPPPAQQPLTAFSLGPQSSSRDSADPQKSGPTFARQSSPTDASSALSQPSSKASAALRDPQAEARKVKDKLSENVARLALTQPHGLIQEYLEYALPAVLRDVIAKHEKQQFDEAIGRLKTNYLSRKFGAIWRSAAWRRNLAKRATKRRQVFAESIRMEGEKKKRDQAELNAILEAMEENKRIKAEIQKRKSVEVQPAQQNQVAGNKRKSLGETNTETSAQKTQQHVHNHKRSRTIGTMLPPPPPLSAKKASSSTSQFGASLFRPQESLRRSMSASKGQQHTQKARLDNTKTDYFRLLASGIDPDTPLVPRTARQVEAKKQKEKEEREAAIARAYNRRRVATPNSALTNNLPSTTSSPLATSPMIDQPSPTPSQTSSIYDPEKDELLQQLKQARQALADDTTWFKEQTTKMEKEVEEEEKLRSSTGSNQSPAFGHSASQTALAQIAQPSFEPSRSMSRVEARLMRTGGLGLAYKPLGGGSDYTPVAMSRKSAKRYNQGEQREEVLAVNGTTKKRRRRGDQDASYRLSVEDLEDNEDDLEMVPQKRPKKQPSAPSHQLVAARKAPVGPPVHNKVPTVEEVYEESEPGSEEELLEDDEEVDQVDSQDDHVRYYSKGRYDIPAEYDEDVEEDEEDLEEEDDDEGEEEEEEYEDEDDGYSGGYHYATQPHQQARYYDDAATPNTQGTSRATSSAPGATADDALVLSDSD